MTRFVRFMDQNNVTVLINRDQIHSIIVVRVRPPYPLVNVQVMNAVGHVLTDLRISDEFFTSVNEHWNVTECGKHLEEFLESMCR